MYISNNGRHVYSLGDILMRLADGMPARVVEESPLYVMVETEGSFPERIEVARGDPAWYMDVPRHLRDVTDLRRTGDFDPYKDDEDEEEEWEGSRVA